MSYSSSFQTLKKAWAMDHKPARPVWEQLAKETGLDVCVVQVSTSILVYTRYLKSQVRWVPFAAKFRPFVCITGIQKLLILSRGSHGQGLEH